MTLVARLLLFAVALTAPAHAKNDVEYGEVISVSDALHGGADKAHILAKFLFNPEYDLLIGVLPRDPYDGNGGRHLVAFDGRLNGKERYLKVTLGELSNLHFKNMIAMTGNRTNADILIVGVQKLEDAEFHLLGEHYPRFLDFDPGHTLETIYSPDRKCHVLRFRKGWEIKRTLIAAVRPEKSQLTYTEQAEIASCINRGHYYHFGYSNVGMFGRKQFAMKRERIGMDLNHAPPFSPLIFNGEHLGQSKDEFLAAVRRFEKDGYTRVGASQADARDAERRELEEDRGRTYVEADLRSRRVTGVYNKTRQFDRWAFVRGQNAFVGVKGKYVQSYYAGNLGRDSKLVLFNHAYLKEKAWGQYLMHAGVPEIADLMIVGVDDLAELKTEEFKQQYGAFLELDEASDAKDTLVRDSLRPRDHANSCAMYRVRKGAAVRTTLVAVRVSRDIAAGNGRSEELLRAVDCINRAHYFHYGFSNVGYQGAGVFADYVDDPDLAIDGGKGFSLPSDADILPAEFMKTGKNVGMKRDAVLKAYLFELWPEGAGRGYAYRPRRKKN